MMMMTMLQVSTPENMIEFIIQVYINLFQDLSIPYPLSLSSLDCQHQIHILLST